MTVSIRGLDRVVGLLLVAFLFGCDSSSDGSAAVVDAGSLRLEIVESPWRMKFRDAAGEEILAEYDHGGDAPVGRIGVFPGAPAQGSGGIVSLPPLELGEPATPAHRDSGWIRATDLVSSKNDGGEWVGTIATDDPDWTIEVRAAAVGDGVIAVSARGVGFGAQAMSIAFGAGAEERFVGFGERSNAVNQFGQVLENYVAEGPYQDSEYPLINEVIPPQGVRWRRDASYFPIPWLLSSRGYGVLVDNDEVSYHRISSDRPDAWAVEVEAEEIRFRVFAGPEPADVLRRFTDEVGRQPSDYAPWFFGPWVQSDRDSRIDELREADVPTSVTATYTHYLPCGSQRGNEERELNRTAVRNAAGTAVHTYFNPMICADYMPEFGVAEGMNALIENAQGDTYLYDYFTSRTFTVSQFDFRSPGGVAAYKSLTDEALSHGYEGWMEDFGEYTPLDAVSSDGATGTAFHNRYARDYHCGVAEATADAGKPLARFARSGWTGSAACTPIVWGGDPTTNFGFDGLESSIYQALSMGTSGVGIWGSDIGGFFAFSPHFLDAELHDRWIGFGALSVVMRSQRNGTNLSGMERPQLWDPRHLEVWRKYAKLHTQLYPYLQAAVEQYLETGMPVMRHHLLTNPGDARAHGRDDQYLFGPDLLVAPVVVQGDTNRSLYLPQGEWAEWWRSVDYVPEDGSFRLAAVEQHAGSAEVVVSAPIDEIPLFIRAGAVIAMLAPDVYTLAEHGSDPSIVRLADRADQLRLLAFPRGSSNGRFFATGSYESRETPSRWTLRLSDQETEYEVVLQASMRLLEQPFEPCEVALGGVALDDAAWSYDDATGVMRVAFASAATLEVSGCDIPM